MEDSLSFEGLLAGAQRFAGLAMAARARPDDELFALHAGVAIERLAKAILVHKDPVLLLEMKGSVEMLFHLTGMKDARKVRTIGMTEAISRLRQLGVLPSDDARVDLLVELRNGVAHASGTETTDDLLPTFARTVGTLLDHVNEDREKFWGNWSTTVTMAINGAHSRVVQDVQLRIQNARYLYDSLASTRPEGSVDDDRDSAPKGPGDAHLFFGLDRTTLTKKIKCPACGAGAKAPITIDTVDSDHTLIIMNQLSCDYCQLALVGDEEMEAAGLEARIEVDMSDESRFADMVRVFVSPDRTSGAWERLIGLPGSPRAPIIDGADGLGT